ncbi:hypothetical protein [Streptomyces sp. NBC_01408]|nr:hypothetical protein [Streptomyces sp. NBC_01408]MCX4696874.1 hypothetical protein [Streptomyces sp. NBC_01408]
MYRISEEIQEVEMIVFGMVPVRVAPPLWLAGADEDEAEFTIVRGID